MTDSLKEVFFGPDNPEEVDHTPRDKYGRPLNYVVGPYLHPNRETRRNAGIRTNLGTLLAYREQMGELNDILDDDLVEDEDA